MPKRIKKPPVEPEVRKKWLERFERDGESARQIATKDGFDVRTVRKHVQLAQQEREIRKARLTVLRNAIERHYGDLCQFAGKLDAEITREEPISSSLKDDRMWLALWQHLPRSPLWNGIVKWNRLLEELGKLTGDVKMRLKSEIEADARLKPILGTGGGEVISAMVEVLTFQCQSRARGWTGLDVKESFEVKPDREEMADIQCGFAAMGKVPKKEVATIKEVLADFESNVTDWEQYDSMKKLFTEVQRLKLDLQDELAIISLRRIVPGKCRYCPL